MILVADFVDEMRRPQHADAVVAQYHLAWSIPDWWKLVKAPHALPAILGEGLPAVVGKLGRPPASWSEFRQALGMDVTAPGLVSADNPKGYKFPQWVRALNACEACGNAALPQQVA